MLLRLGDHYIRTLFLGYWRRALSGNWVRDVIGDDKLARDLARARSREQAGRAVVQRLSLLRSKL